MTLNTKEEQKAFLDELDIRLQQSSEAPFWKDGIMPASTTILQILDALHTQNLLFTPEGTPLERLDFENFLRWFDLVSVKLLLFTLDESNSKKSLQNTKYPKDKATQYQAVDITQLAQYLSKQGVDLHDKTQDFPSRNYTKHMEYANIIRRLMQS